MPDTTDEAPTTSATSTSKLWHRNVWMEAVWESDLRSTERLVAAVYADHARDLDHAWVTRKRIAKRSGLSERTATDARQKLRANGWLVELTPAAQHKTDVYRLVVPGVQEVQPCEPVSSDATAPLQVAGVQEAQPAAQYSPPRGARRSPNLSPTKANQSETRMRADDLAVFSKSHPGREAEALTGAMEWFARKYLGQKCKLPSKYFGQWSATELRTQITLPTPEKPSRSDCPDCLGGHWLTDDDGKITGKCTHPQQENPGQDTIRSRHANPRLRAV